MQLVGAGPPVDCSRLCRGLVFAWWHVEPAVHMMHLDLATSEMCSFHARGFLTGREGRFVVDF